MAREVWRYTKLFWINSGRYNNLTARKFVLTLSRRGAGGRGRGRGRRRRPVPAAAAASRPAALARRLAPLFLDPAVDPMVTNKTPGADGDLLRDSANNLYGGVTMADLDGLRRALSAQLAAGEARRAAR